MRTFLCALLAVLLLSPSVAHSAVVVVGLHEAHQELADITASPDLSIREKADAFHRHMRRFSNIPLQWRRMENVDSKAVLEIALYLFDREEVSRAHKYEIGRYILQRVGEGVDRDVKPAPEFIRKYREFLIGAILDGGEEEFNREKTDTATAIGEYAGIAGGINRPAGILFSDVHDVRVIPVLIRSLSAPDHVHGSRRASCIRMGTPGESTGRNTQRQGLPLALARLGATEAIPKLREILAEHHDFYLRSNSAFALGRLSTDGSVQGFEEAIRATGDRRFFFHFGKGLVERGEYRGFAYLAFEYSVYSQEGNPSSMAYMLEKRLPYLKGVRHPQAAAFYRQVISSKPLRHILLFDAKSVEPRRKRALPGQGGEFNLEDQAMEELQRSEERLVSVYMQVLEGMRLNEMPEALVFAKTIRDGTRSERIRKASAGFLE